MLVSFHTLAFVCVSETEYLNLDNLMMAHLTETVETAMTATFL